MRPIVSSLLAAGLGLALSIYPAPARGTTAEAHVSVRIPLASGAVARVELPAGTEVERTSSAGDSWILAGTRPVGERREILLITGQGASGTRRTYPAPVSSSRIQAEPLPLLVSGRIAGLAWLEGAERRSYAVKAARWTGRRWTRAETIARPGPGSQLALTAARLSDGSWLLAWAGFDGRDDEIWWSRGRPGAGWTAPARVAADNGVPDITPALTATASGALLAWSSFDGNDYRVVASELSGSTGSKWSAPRAIGPAGSVFPSFEPAEGSPRILYRTAAPRGWEAVELGAGTKIARRASVVADSSERPALSATTAGAVTFRWPGAESAAVSAVPALSARWSEEP